MKRTSVLALAVCLGIQLPVQAIATEWKTELRTGFEFQGETDLDEGGDFDFWLWQLGATVSGKMTENVSLQIDAHYQAIGYDFGGLGFDPWETVHVFRLSPRFRGAINETWSIAGGPFFEFSGEGGAEIEDSVSVGGLFGVGYRMSDDLGVTLGLMVRTEIEDDAYVQPWVQLDWDITENLNFALRGGSSRGGQLRLGYTFLDDWEVAIGGGFRRERFRLNDDSPSVRKDGVGQEEATVATASIAYAFREHWSVDLYGGVTIDGEFDLDNERGNKIADSDYDDSGYGGIKLSYAF